MSRKPVRNLTLVAVVLFTAGAGMLVWGVAAFNEPGPLEADTVVLLPRGASVRQIATILQDNGVLDEPALFRFAVRLSGESGNLRAGEYEVPAASSMRSVIALLTIGKTLVRRVTIAEGLAVVEALAVVREAGGLTGELPGQIAEGTLLPETYHYSYGDTRADIVARMRAAMDELLGDLWPDRAEGLPFDTVEEALVLASIVEKETAVPEERARIAGVFVNRLRRGMRLQSDPTVVYAITRGRALGRRLTRTDLDTDSPYNTYRNRGLPPGPIANPGRASIEAVLHPADTKDLYFVADGTGGHAFAETLEAHQRNVRRWRRIRVQQD